MDLCPEPGSGYRELVLNGARRTTPPPLRPSEEFKHCRDTGVHVRYSDGCYLTVDVILLPYDEQSPTRISRDTRGHSMSRGTKHGLRPVCSSRKPHLSSFLHPLQRLGVGPPIRDFLAVASRQHDIQPYGLAALVVVQTHPGGGQPEALAEALGAVGVGIMGSSTRMS